MIPYDPGPCGSLGLQSKAAISPLTYMRGAHPVAGGCVGSRANLAHQPDPKGGPLAALRAHSAAPVNGFIMGSSSGASEAGTAVDPAVRMENGGTGRCPGEQATVRGCCARLSGSAALLGNARPNADVARDPHSGSEGCAWRGRRGHRPLFGEQRPHSDVRSSEMSRSEAEGPMHNADTSGFRNQQRPDKEDIDLELVFFQIKK